jgi:hypothetical protein
MVTININKGLINILKSIGFLTYLTTNSIGNFLFGILYAIGTIFQTLIFGGIVFIIISALFGKIGTYIIFFICIIYIIFTPYSYDEYSEIWQKIIMLVGYYITISIIFYFFLINIKI